MHEVKLFTDGSCWPNPGPGGWAFLFEFSDGSRAGASGFEKETTNNRMELAAVVNGLAALPMSCRVIVTTDSMYVVRGIERLNRLKKKLPMANYDLWVSYSLIARRHKVIPIWVRGHSGHPENEICNEYAEKARTEQASTIMELCQLSTSTTF